MFWGGATAGLGTVIRNGLKEAPQGSPMKHKADESCAEGGLLHATLKHCAHLTADDMIQELKAWYHKARTDGTTIGVPSSMFNAVSHRFMSRHRDVLVKTILPPAPGNPDSIVILARAALLRSSQTNAVKVPQPSPKLLVQGPATGGRTNASSSMRQEVGGSSAGSQGSLRSEGSLMSGFSDGSPGVNAAGLLAERRSGLPSDVVSGNGAVAGVGSGLLASAVTAGHGSLSGLSNNGSTAAAVVGGQGYSLSRLSNGSPHADMVGGHASLFTGPVSNASRANASPADVMADSHGTSPGHLVSNRASPADVLVDGQSSMSGLLGSKPAAHDIPHAGLTTLSNGSHADDDSTSLQQALEDDGSTSFESSMFAYGAADLTGSGWLGGAVHDDCDAMTVPLTPAVTSVTTSRRASCCLDEDEAVDDFVHVVKIGDSTQGTTAILWDEPQQGKQMHSLLAITPPFGFEVYEAPGSCDEGWPSDKHGWATGSANVVKAVCDEAMSSQLWGWLPQVKQFLGRNQSPR